MKQNISEKTKMCAGGGGGILQSRNLGLLVS